MSDKDNTDKNNIEQNNNQFIDWDVVKENIKDYTGDYFKVTLNVGADIKGTKLYEVGKMIDDSVKMTMGIDKYFLMSSKYMVYSTGFVTKNGISIYELCVAYKSHDANTFLKSSLSTAITIVATALAAETGPVLAPIIGGVVGQGSEFLWDSFISKTETGQLAIKLTDHYVFDKDNGVDISVFNNWLPVSGDKFSLVTTETAVIDMANTAYQITQFYNYFYNKYASDPSVDKDNLEDTINKVLKDYYDNQTDYTIASGDTLSDIARKFQTSVEQLLSLNPSITDPDKIIAGATLHIPLSSGVALEQFKKSGLFKLLNGLLRAGASGPDTSEATRVSDPVVIDLNGDGVKTIGKSAGILFDHDGNLFAENTGWVSPEDGLLVIDKNHDGKIDSGNELFGSNSVQSDGSIAKTGYEALRGYDENHDGVIDQKDTIWSQLQVWQDRNSNGVVDEGELSSLDKLNIATVRLDYNTLSFTDSEGNRHLQQGKVIYTDGHTGLAEDIGLDVDKSKTQYTGDTTVSEDILLLPYIRGFGNLPDLQVAMSRNDSLKVLVSQYKDAGESEQYKLVEQIIYTWAGVNKIDPHSRGSNVNARHLGVLEVTTGEAYRTLHNAINPLPRDGVLLEKEYRKFYGYVNAMLQAQTTYKDIFSKIKVTLDKDCRDFTLNFQEIEKAISGMSNQSDVLNLRSLLFSFLTYMPQFDDIRNSVGVSFVRDDAENDIYQSENNHSDYYLFEKNHGHDVITDYAADSDHGDTLVFRQAQSGQATFDHVGSDLVIHAYGDDNSVTLKNYFISDYYQRYHLVFDDATLEADQVL
ncbi:LysM peptidoglycan-binding domain-containing protein, partial [Salmonella enterica]|nr:LysM peptidoglycan-binding domain-containing protein [Salmonella enterica]